jgi:hypothetical protein
MHCVPFHSKQREKKGSSIASSGLKLVRQTSLQALRLLATGKNEREKRYLEKRTDIKKDWKGKSDGC